MSWEFNTAVKNGHFLSVPNLAHLQTEAHSCHLLLEAETGRGQRSSSLHPLRKDCFYIMQVMFLVIDHYFQSSCETPEVFWKFSGLSVVSSGGMTSCLKDGDVFQASSFLSVRAAHGGNLCFTLMLFVQQQNIQNQNISDYCWVTEESETSRNGESGRNKSLKQSEAGAKL